MSVPSLPIRVSQSSHRWCWRLRGVVVILFLLSLPRPWPQEVPLSSPRGTSLNSPKSVEARQAFRAARRLIELTPKGSLSEETEFSGPSLDSSGETLYLTRSRPGQRADLFQSSCRDGRWTHPSPLRDLNSVDDDRHLTVNDDGSVAVFASNRSGGRGGFDLYESSLRNGRWTRPKNLGVSINTDTEEFDPAVSSDGLTLFFVRIVPDSTADIYRSSRTSLAAEWSVAQPVSGINTVEFHERSPTFGPDNTLWFASNRSSGNSNATQFDLFRASSLADRPQVIRLSDGIASEFDETDPTISKDGERLIFASKREGSRQLFESHADWIVTRWSWESNHLRRFGQFQLAAPFVAAGILIIVWRKTRARNVSPLTNDDKATQLDVARRDSRTLQASSANTAKNPLANWPVSNPTRSEPSAKLPHQNQKTASTSTTPSAAPKSQRWGAVITAILLMIVLSIVIPHIERGRESLHSLAPTEITVLSLRDIRVPERPLSSFDRATNFPELVSKFPGSSLPEQRLSSLAKWSLHSLGEGKSSFSTPQHDVQSELISVPIAKSPLALIARNPVRPSEYQELIDEPRTPQSAHRPSEQLAFTALRPMSRTSFDASIANSTVVIGDVAAAKAIRTSINSVEIHNSQSEPRVIATSLPRLSSANLQPAMATIEESSLAKQIQLSMNSEPSVSPPSIRRERFVDFLAATEPRIISPGFSQLKHEPPATVARSAIDTHSISTTPVRLPERTFRFNQVVQSAIFVEDAGKVAVSATQSPIASDNSMAQRPALLPLRKLDSREPEVIPKWGTIVSGINPGLSLKHELAAFLSVSAFQAVMVPMPVTLPIRRIAPPRVIELVEELKPTP